MLNSVLCGLLCEMWQPHGKCAPLLIKVAEHGFQEPMPNSPLLLYIYALGPVFRKRKG